MLSLIGPQAERLAGAFPADLHCVVFDINSVAKAFLEAMRRRAAGERFFILPLADGYLVTEYAGVAAMLIAQVQDADTRYAYARELTAGLLRLNDIPVSEKFAKDERPWDLVYQTILLSDELLVRSHYEYTTFYAPHVSGHRMRRMLPAATAPAFTPAKSTNGSVVIWSGRRSITDASIALIGSEQLRTPVIFVGSEPVATPNVRFVGANDPDVPRVLAAAGCVVCIDPSDPSDAVEFARRGKSVVAPITSGAIEYVPDIATWDPIRAQTLYRSVAIAIGRHPSGIAGDSVPLEPARPTYPMPESDLPLVSIITPTYNRPDMLRRMLTCIAAQTYPNIESVVVNDAGCAVEDVVADFPFVRLYNQETNGGTLTAMERGLHESRGEYIGLLPDDDWLFPDHVERLMLAIFRSGSPSSMLRFVEHDADGNEVTTGYNGRSFSETVNPSDALIGTPVAHHQVLLRRDLYDPDNVGWFLKDTIVADQEYHMRLTENISSSGSMRSRASFSITLVIQESCTIGQRVPSGSSTSFNRGQIARSSRRYVSRLSIGCVQRRSVRTSTRNRLSLRASIGPKPHPVRRPGCAAAIQHRSRTGAASSRSGRRTVSRAKRGLRR